MGYSFQIRARDRLYAPSNKLETTYVSIVTPIVRCKNGGEINIGTHYLVNGVSGGSQETPQTACLRIPKHVHIPWKRDFIMMLITDKVSQWIPSYHIQYIQNVILGKISSVVFIILWVYLYRRMKRLSTTSTCS